MAVQNLVRQRIGFILNDTSQTFDPYDVFMQNSLLQTCQSNSVSNSVQSGFDHYNTTTASANEQAFFYLDFRVTPTFQATMQSNFTSLQSAFSPKYTLFTEGVNTAWGF